MVALNNVFSVTFTKSKIPKVASGVEFTKSRLCSSSHDGTQPGQCCRYFFLGVLFVSSHYDVTRQPWISHWEQFRVLPQWVCPPGVSCKPRWFCKTWWPVKRNILSSPGVLVSPGRISTRSESPEILRILLILEIPCNSAVMQILLNFLLIRGLYIPRGLVRLDVLGKAQRFQKLWRPCKPRKPWKLWED